MKKKSLHQVRIEKFMKLAGQECPFELTQASVKIRKLRARLILEEALEAIAELGVTVSASDSVIGLTTAVSGIDDLSLQVNESFTVDYCSLAKELADLSVVTTGSLSSFGIADVGLLELVDNNNLSKFGPGWAIREDGKLIKPAGFKKLSISKSDL